MDLQSAVAHNHVEKVSLLLQQGESPHQDDADFSLLHTALNNRVVFQARLQDGETQLIAPKHMFLNILRDEEGQTQIRPTILPGVYQTSEERDRAETIAHLLLAYGARLEKAPSHSNDPCPPLHDAGLWTDSTFGARILLSAIYTAFKRGEALPRLNPRATIEQQMLVAEPTDSWRVLARTTAEHMERLRHTVAQNLFTKSSPTAAFLAANLPATERLYWSPRYQLWQQNIAQPLEEKYKNAAPRLSCAA